MKTVIKGFINYRKARFAGEPEFDFSPTDLTGSDLAFGRVMVMAHEFEVETPDNFDPRQQQVQALEKERQKLRADFAKRCAEIERQISELTCLEATVNADFEAHRESLEVGA